MKKLVAATLLLLAPALAYAHHPYESRNLNARRQELPRVRSGASSGGVTQPEKWEPPKQSANDPKATPSHGS